MFTSVNRSELSAAEHFDRIDFVQFVDVARLRTRGNDGENAAHLVAIRVVSQERLTNLRVRVASVLVRMNQIVFLQARDEITMFSLVDIEVY